jgi:GTP-binding protein EngB required for normal cell division
LYVLLTRLFLCFLWCMCCFYSYYNTTTGKSTLLNALLYGSRPAPGQSTSSLAEAPKKYSRRSLGPTISAYPKGSKATMSAKPGETKKISFYELSAQKGQHRVRLADLPGYGFAHASDELSTAYAELMGTYLCHKRRPQRVLLLLDARHGFKQTDRLFLQDLQKRDYQLPALQIVLTKCDLVEAADLARRVVQVQNDLNDCLRRQSSGRLPVLLTSATRRNGILAVQKELAGLVQK